MLCKLCEESMYCQIHDPEKYPHAFVPPAKGYRCRLDGCGLYENDPLHNDGTET